MGQPPAQNARIYILILLILAGEAIFLLPFILPRIFRPTFLKVFEISNLELGACFSAYGLVAMVAYFFGGPLADRFPARNLMAVALWTTALGGFALATIPSPSIMSLIYAYWGLTTILLFWAALIKATRAWGGPTSQGKAFGFLDAGRGFTAALLGTIGLAIFTTFSGDAGSDEFSAQRNASFQIVIASTAGIVVLVGFLIWFFIPKRIASEDEVLHQFNWQQVGTLVKMPAIWMQAIIIVCGYVGYKITDDFSLYANEVLGFDEVNAAGIGTLSIWVRPVFAVLAGLLADRFLNTRIIMAGFALIIVGGILIFLGWFTSIVWLSLFILTTILLGTYGVRAIYFSMMQITKIPLPLTGTAVGIISVLGFTPDVFMSPLMGYFLDTYPGPTGHGYVFLVLSIFAGIGLLTSIFLDKTIRQ